MKLTWRRIICLVMSIVFIFSSSLQSLAAETNDEVVNLDSSIRACEYNEGISACATSFMSVDIDVVFLEEGIYADIYTIMNGTASIVGVKDIVVQLKTLFGWTTVATVSGGSTSGVSGMCISFTYTGAVDGATYRIKCTHYGNVDEYIEIDHTTAAFVYSKP